jgi:hypothetical protein
MGNLVVAAWRQPNKGLDHQLMREHVPFLAIRTNEFVAEVAVGIQRATQKAPPAL